MRAANLADLNSYRYVLQVEREGGSTPQDLQPLLAPTGGATGTGSKLVFSVAGAYVKPDKAEMTMVLGQTTIRRTIIGSQQWAIIAGTREGPEPFESKEPYDLSFAAQVWDGSKLPRDFHFFVCEASFQEVNKVQARKCALNSANYGQLSLRFLGFPRPADVKELSSFVLQVWLSEAGFPVRMQAGLAWKDKDANELKVQLQLDVLDFNQAIVIARPS